MSNKNPQGSAKRGIVEFLSSKAELPSDILTGDFKIEMRGRNTVFIQGCRRILKYSPCIMVMAVKNFAVEIIGERLVCSAYHDGTISIDGYIKTVNIDDGEEGGCR